MRLTNIAQMRLPRGRVRSLALRVAVDDAPGPPISFDQRRHVAAGDRPGSWMALSLRMPPGTDLAEIADAWVAVVERHGTLTTLFRPGAEGPTLHGFRVLGHRWRRHDGDDVRRTVRRVLDRGCRPFGSPSHLLVVVEPAADELDARPVAVIGSDHAHVDMWSLLVLARDLLAHVGAAPPGPAAVAPFAAHTLALTQAPPAPEAVVARWSRLLAEGDGAMPLFPLPLGEPDPARPAHVAVRDVLDAAGWERFATAATRQGVRSTALAMSCLARATRTVADAPLRAVFPVSSRPEPRWHDAVGWFITNSILDCPDPSPDACASALTQAVALAAHALAPIFAPYGGMPQRPGMFAISWLDLRRPPVTLPPESDVQYVSSVLAVDDVMAWFVITTEGLHVRYRHPDTAQAHTAVSSWIEAVIASFSTEASTEASPVPGAAQRT